MALICDTGPLYAALDRNDRDHARCADLLSTSDDRLHVPAPVLVELEWLVSSRMGFDPFEAFLLSIEAREIRVEALGVGDYRRIRELCRSYDDLPLGFVDAAVIAVAERLRERKVATLDRRHFTVVRPDHTVSLALLPE